MKVWFQQTTTSSMMFLAIPQEVSLTIQQAHTYGLQDVHSKLDTNQVNSLIDNRGYATHHNVASNLLFYPTLVQFNALVDRVTALER